MALQARPTVLPEWASAPAIADLVEPSAGRKASGWTTTGGIPDVPPYEWVNWQGQTIYQWVRHISERILTGSRITLANNQAAAANLTGVLVPPADYGAFILELNVRVRATTNRFALIQVRANWNDQTSAWELSRMETSAERSEIVLSVTAGGQVQYTTPSYPGFVSAVADFNCFRFPQLHT